MIAALLFSAALIAQQPFVLAIGVNKSAHEGLAPLNYADDDAAAAAELFGASPQRTILLTTLDDDSQERFASLRRLARPATTAQLGLAVGTLATAVRSAIETGERPVVIVWLVGHGAFTKDGQPYVALEDGELTPSLLYATVLKPLSLAHRVHVILDACHSGAMLSWRAKVEHAGEAEVNRQSFVGSVEKPANIGLISAAGAGQKTYEWNELRAGIFSALARAALRGAANADGDRCVSYGELAAYVSAALQGIALPQARPHVVVHPPAVDTGAPLACDAWFSPRMSFHVDSAALGWFRVEDARGSWLTGGRFEDGHAAELWLPRQTGLSVRTREGEWPLRVEGGSFTLPPRPAASQAQPRGVVERAIEEGLFRVPYGPSFLRGYLAARPGDAEPSTKAARPAPRRSRSLWRALLPMPSAVLALAATAAAAVSAVFGAWQGVLYLTTDLQRPAAHARIGAMVGFSLCAIAAAAAVGAALFAVCIAALWLWLG